MRLDNQNKRSKMKSGFIMLVIQMVIFTVPILAEPLPQVPHIKIGRGYAERVRFSPDGKYLAVKTTLHQIELFSTQNWKRVGSIKGDWMDFSPDGKHIAYRAWFPNARTYRIRLWDIEAQRVKAILAGPVGYYLQFSPDGNLLACVSQKRIYLWDIRALAKPHDVLEFQGNGLNLNRTLDFSPDGRLLACGAFDGKVRIWNVASKQLLRNL